MELSQSCYNFNPASEIPASFPLAQGSAFLNKSLYTHGRDEGERERGALHSCHIFLEPLTSNGLKLLKYSG